MADLAPVLAPPAAPPRVGLLQSARSPTDPPGTRWERGFSYAPEGCADGGTFDPCVIVARDPADPAAKVDYEPFYAWAADKCSTFGFDARDWRGRAERLLASQEGSQIEEELWKGTLAQASGWPNRFLADEVEADTITAGATAEAQALAILEQALAECNGGQQGMIHAPRSVVSLWQQGGALRREGALILTVNETIVVPGAGYDGSGPNGQAAVDGSVWVYATGTVEVRRSAVEIVPGSLQEARQAAPTNEVEMFAQRLAAASWDGCCHFAAEVDAPVPDIGGLGS